MAINAFNGNYYYKTTPTSKVNNEDITFKGGMPTYNQYNDYDSFQSSYKENKKTPLWAKVTIGLASSIGLFFLGRHGAKVIKKHANNFVDDVFTKMTKFREETLIEAEKVVKRTINNETSQLKSKIDDVVNHANTSVEKSVKELQPKIQTALNEIIDDTASKAKGKISMLGIIKSLFKKNKN